MGLGTHDTLASGIVLRIHDRGDVVVFSVEMPNGDTYATYFPDMGSANRAAWVIDWVTGGEG